MNERLIKETAQAWDMTPQEVRKIVDWVEAYIAPYKQAYVFGRVMVKRRERRYKAMQRRLEKEYRPILH